MRRFIKKFFPMERETIQIREAMTALLRRVPSATSFLDVGCADGAATWDYARLWNLPTEGIRGIESQPMYNRGNMRFTPVAIDIERELFPFADGTFDVVMCNQVLEHLKIVLAPTREMVRVTKIGGFLAIGIPNLASLMGRAYLLAGRNPIGMAFPGPHIRGYSHHAFLSFLRENPNLSLEAVSSAVFYPFPEPFSAPLARFFPSLSCYTFYLLRKIRHAPEQDWPRSRFLDESLTG